MSSSATIVVSPSEQSRKRSPGSASTVDGVDVDVGVGAERAGDHRALRVLLGLLGGEPAASHEVADEGVVLGELLERARSGSGMRASRRRGRASTRPPVRSAAVTVVPMPETSESLRARS